MSLTSLTLKSVPPSVMDATATTNTTIAPTNQMEAQQFPQPQEANELKKDERFALNEDGLAIFGSQLFQGKFSDLSFSGFNPNYQIGVGDHIQIMIWGAMDNALELTVDAKGNIFIPKVGPVSVLGIRNEDLNSLVSTRIQKVYKDNIESYANLRSTQTVKVFVSGFVEKPGLYQGFASDSVLYFLDQAGGVDALRGSYRDISLVRSGTVKAQINLYDFLKNGTLPLSQFRDGDVVLVGPRGATITVTGEVINPALFEFESERISLSEALSLASPKAGATSASIRRARDGVSSATVLNLKSVNGILLGPGDQVAINGRNIAQTILIEYTGEHEGQTNAVLKRGATLADAIEQINPSLRSNLDAISIYRASVAQRQKQLLQQSLDNLERHVIGASSISLEEAQLRKVESETILAFIERAREVEPKGQILLESLEEAANLYLEDGDIIHIPTKTNLVTVYGEVQYPNTQTIRSKDSLIKYIDRAGGFSENANEKDIIIIQPNGLIKQIGKGRGATVLAGDEIIVLPKADGKTLLFAKEISTIVYQIALSARVAIGL